MSRNYSSTAASTALAAPINDSQTTMTVSATSGFPATPFVLAIDGGTVSQELVLVTGVAGSTLTVTRGYDSTSAVAHLAGATVEHSHAAIDFREAAQHRDATDGVHGVTGDLVGTSDTQALTNKDLSSGTNTFPSSLATDVEVTAASDAAAAALAAHEADTTTHGVSGAIVGISDAQTLTNKTIALGSNTVSGTTAQFNAAITDADFATLAGTETLTNKDLSSPTNTFPAKPFVSVARAAAQTIPTGGYVNISFDTQVEDTDSMFAGGGSPDSVNITVNTAGLWLVTGLVGLVANATGTRGVAIVLNGTQIATTLPAPPASGSFAASVSTQVRCDVGDVINLAVTQTTGGGLNTHTATEVRPALQMTWLGA